MGSGLLALLVGYLESGGTVALVGGKTLAAGARLGRIRRAWAAMIVLSAFRAFFVDTLPGAAPERRGQLDNEAVDFGARLSAALASFWRVELVESEA